MRFRFADQLRVYPWVILYLPATKVEACYRYDCAMENDFNDPSFTLKEQFRQPVEGYSFSPAARAVAAVIVVALVGSLGALLIWGPLGRNSAIEFGLVGLVVAFLGAQIVFGKTRIDVHGLRRASLYRPELSWTQMNKVSYQSGWGTPRLAVGSMVGPMRFHAGTPELRAAFRLIADYYSK